MPRRNWERTMFRPFANYAFIAAVAVLLAACSSSPSRETSTAEPKTSESKPAASKRPSTKSDAKAGGKEEMAETGQAPGGPPPIPVEATQRFENALTMLSAGDLAKAEPELKLLAETYPEYSGA